MLLEGGEIDAAGVARVSGHRARHLIDVLNVSPGHEVRVGVIDGPTGVGRVTSCRAGDVELCCTLDARMAPRPPVDLLLALPRPKVLRRLWAQLASLGVGQIILTNAARVERNYFDTHVVTEACYRPLLIEGLQQARDTRLPAVSIHRQFKVLVEDHLDSLFPEGLRLVADPGTHTPLTTAVRARGGLRNLVAVGPEGGWNDYERELLRTHGFERVDMGPRTLRSDTACIAIVALVHDAIRAAAVAR